MKLCKINIYPDNSAVVVWTVVAFGSDPLSALMTFVYISAGIELSVIISLPVKLAAIGPVFVISAASVVVIPITIKRVKNVIGRFIFLVVLLDSRELAGL